MVRIAMNKRVTQDEQRIPYQVCVKEGVEVGESKTIN